MIQLVILAAGIFAHGTKAVNPLVEKIREHNMAMLEMERPTGADVFVYDYTTEFSYYDEEMTAQKIRTKVYMGEKNLHFFSDKFDLFMDENYVATIMKDERQIIITRSVQDYDPLYALTQLTTAQNFMLDSAKIITQKQLENGLVELKLDTRHLGWSNFYVQDITYQCDPKTGEIKKSITTYSEEYEIASMIYTMHEINFKGRYNGFKPVEKMLFKANMTLLDQYKGFEIIVD